MTSPTNPAMDEVERVARAMRTFAVEGVVYADDAGSCYRVMQGAVAIGGDYPDLSDAQAACDLLNARAAIASLAPDLQQENARLREALLACRTSICGYNLHDADDAFATVGQFHKEICRIDGIARAALGDRP